jgi:hypothetical protein
VAAIRKCSREDDLMRERECPSAANTPFSYNNDCLQPISPFPKVLLGEIAR